MQSIVSQKWFRVTVLAVVSGTMYILASKFPSVAAQLAALGTTVAGILPSALAGAKDDGAQP